MPHKTINRTSIIDQFNLFMKSDSPFRVMRLMGEAKIGKSHLATKIFPMIAEKGHQAHSAVMDLRNPMQTIPDILHTICGQFHDKDLFTSYYAAHQEFLKPSQMEYHHLLTIFAYIRMTIKGESGESARMIRHLNDGFIADIRKSQGVLLLLVFDTVDQADESIHRWLIYSLLAQLARETHLRVVLSGRSVPEVSGSCAPICCSHELAQVQEPEAYISYCHQVGATLQEQSIRDLAKASNYRPGFFADLVINNFVPFENIYG